MDEIKHSDRSIPLKEAVEQGKVHILVSEECFQDISANNIRIHAPVTEPISEEEVKEWQEADEKLQHIDLDKVREKVIFEHDDKPASC